jgi:hypothetical protein
MFEVRDALMLEGGQQGLLMGLGDELVGQQEEMMAVPDELMMPDLEMDMDLKRQGEFGEDRMILVRSQCACAAAVMADAQTAGWLVRFLVACPSLKTALPSNPTGPQLTPAHRPWLLLPMQTCSCRTRPRRRPRASRGGPPPRAPLPPQPPLTASASSRRRQRRRRWTPWPRGAAARTSLPQGAKAQPRWVGAGRG